MLTLYHKLLQTVNNLLTILLTFLLTTSAASMPRRRFGEHGGSEGGCRLDVTAGKGPAAPGIARLRQMLPREHAAFRVLRHAQVGQYRFHFTYILFIIYRVITLANIIPYSGKIFTATQTKNQTTTGAGASAAAPVVFNNIPLYGSAYLIASTRQLIRMPSCLPPQMPSD